MTIWMWIAGWVVIDLALVVCITKMLQWAKQDDADEIFERLMSSVLNDPEFGNDFDSKEEV